MKTYLYQIQSATASLVYEYKLTNIAYPSPSFSHQKLIDLSKNDESLRYPLMLCEELCSARNGTSFILIHDDSIPGTSDEEAAKEAARAFNVELDKKSNAKYKIDPDPDYHPGGGGHGGLIFIGNAQGIRVQKEISNVEYKINATEGKADIVVYVCIYIRVVKSGKIL